MYNPSTGGKIKFIFNWNWMMTVFSLHISTTLHLTIFGIWSNNIQSVQNVICVMIMGGLWYIGLAIWYTIWIVARLSTSRGTFLCINGKTTLSPLDATAARYAWISRSAGFCRTGPGWPAGPTLQWARPQPTEPHVVRHTYNLRRHETVDPIRKLLFGAHAINDYVTYGIMVR